MANGAAGTYFSPQNRGLATVLPTGTQAQVFDQLMGLAQLKDRQQLRAAQAAQQQRENLAKELEQLQDKNISVQFRPYQKTIAEQNSQLQKKWGEALKKTGGMLSLDQRVQMNEDYDKLRRKAQAVESVKQQVTDFISQIPKDSPIDTKNLNRLVAERLVDENGELKDPEDLDMYSIFQDVQNDPEAYDTRKVVDDFAESVPEQINNLVEVGSETRTEYEIKSKFYKLDDNGDIAYDDPNTNEPTYNITPELVNAFKQSTGGKAILTSMVNSMFDQGYKGTLRAAEQDALETLLADKAYKNVTRANVENMPSRGDGSGGGTKEERLALNRKESIRKSIFEGDQSEANRILGGQTFSLGGGVGARGEKGKITNLKYVSEAQQPFVLSPDQQTAYDPSQTERLPIVEIEYTIEATDSVGDPVKGKQRTRLNLNKPEDRKRYAQIINEAANSKEGSNVGWDTLMPQYEDLEQGYTPPKIEKVNSASDFINKYGQ